MEDGDTDLLACFAEGGIKFGLFPISLLGILIWLAEVVIRPSFFLLALGVLHNFELRVLDFWCTSMAVVKAFLVVAILLFDEH